MRNLRAYLAEEREATGGALPTDRQIVVERFRDELGDWRICVLSPFGARVHAPWALAIEAKVRDRLDVEVQAIWTDDGIVVRLPEADEAPPVDSVLLDPEEIEELVVGEVANVGAVRRPASGRTRPGPCCCPAAGPGPARRCGSSASGPPTCWRWRRSTARSRSCWRPTASACATCSTCRR